MWNREREADSQDEMKLILCPLSSRVLSCLFFFCLICLLVLVSLCVCRCLIASPSRSPARFSLFSALSPPSSSATDQAAPCLLFRPSLWRRAVRDFALTSLPPRPSLCSSPTSPPCWARARTASTDSPSTTRPSKKKKKKKRKMINLMITNTMERQLQGS